MIYRHSKRHAPAPRGFAALMYAITLAASLLMLTITIFAEEAASRQQLLQEEDSDRAYLAARTCVAFALRAFSTDLERIVRPGTQVHTNETAVCVIDHATRSETTTDISAHARIGTHTSHVVAHAIRDADGSYELQSLHDGTE